MRRSYLQMHELPGRLVGVALARPADVRRVLGARRGGRDGVALALLALLLATPDMRDFAGLAALHVIASLSGAVLGGPLRAHERLRLSLWCATTPLLLAALARLAGAAGAWPALAGVAVGQVLLWRAAHGLRPRV